MRIWLNRTGKFTIIFFLFLFINALSHHTYGLYSKALNSLFHVEHEQEIIALKPYITRKRRIKKKMHKIRTSGCRCGQDNSRNRNRIRATSEWEVRWNFGNWYSRCTMESTPELWLAKKNWMKMMLMTDFWPLHSLRLYSAMRELVERRSSNCVRYHLPADCRAEAQIRDYWVHNPFQLLRQLHHPHTRYTLLLPPDCLPDLFMPQWMRIFAINLLSVHTKSDIFCGVWRGKEDYIRVYYV